MPLDTDKLGLVIGSHDQVKPWQFSGQAPEGFANLASLPVAVYRAGKQSLGNDHAQPCVAQIVRPGQDLKMLRAHGTPMRKHRLEFRRL